MRFALLMLVVGCTSSPPSLPPPPPDVVGPFTGTAHRFVIDRMKLVPDSGPATQIGDDLDGDGKVDNEAANLIGLLKLFNNSTSHGPDMIASGVIASELEIIADDLTADDSAAVRYRGVAGDQPTPVGGKLSATGFAPNRTRYTRVPGEAVVRLPVFADADPVTVRVVGLQIELTSDGHGGFDGVVAGGVLVDDLSDALHTGIAQMIAANPQDHLILAALSDTNHDGVLTREEILSAAVVSPPSRLDIQLFDRGEFGAVHPYVIRDAMSVGFLIHAAPCASGRCSSAPPADRCHDRVLDGDETDIDCGGSCGRCPAAAGCAIAADCQTDQCDGGRCRAPTCTDQLRDGFETDLDCGGGCAPCGSGGQCVIAHDCQSGRCEGTCL